MAERAHLRILMLEDNLQDVFLLRASLQKVGFRDFKLLHAERLSEVPPLVQGSAPDLIITDLNLPDSMGVDTVRKLARQADGIPILVLTGHSDAKLEPELLQNGAAGQMSKDLLHTPALAQTIERLLKT